MALTLVAPPDDEPVTLVEAKMQVRRTDVTDDDELLNSLYIPAARERAEQATGRQILTATWDLALDGIPCEGWIDVPKPPLIRVVSIAFVQTDGTTLTWTISQLSGSSWIAGADAGNVQVDAPSGPHCARGRVAPAYGLYWPVTRDQFNAVTVRFMAGYGSRPSDCPARLKMAMLEDLGSLYEHREDMVIGQGYTISEMPLGSRSIYGSYKSHPQQR